MYKIVDKTIHLTRGDACTISTGVSVEKEDGTTVPYIFQPGDIVTFGVYEKKHFNQSPVLLKVITVEAESERVNICLNSNETKLGEISHKAITYWYEIQLNHQQTIIGFDDSGPKELILYPEGVDQV